MHKTTPLFTVIVAVYNATAWLSECLNSLLGQTEKRLQVICVDDASTDDSLKLLHDYAAHDSRLKVLALPENVGQAKARNAAIAHIEGQYALMVDADDSLSADALENLHRYFQRHPEADCVLLTLVRTYPDGHTELREASSPSTVWNGAEACNLLLQQKIHGLYAVRSDFYRQWAFDDSTRLYSDDNTSALHYLKAREVVQSEAIYYWRQHKASATHQPGDDRLYMLEANASLRRTLEREHAPRPLLQSCEHWVWHNVVNLWRMYWQQQTHFSTDTLQTAPTRFRTALHAIRPLRLPLRDWCVPAYIYLPSYTLFCRWQRLLLYLHKALHH